MSTITCKEPSASIRSGGVLPMSSVPRRRPISMPVIVAMDTFSTRDKWFSPSFKSHIKGYNLCFSVTKVQIKGGCNRCLELQSYILPGLDDDHLSWPFEGLIIVKILNQLDESRGNHTYMFEYDQDNYEGMRVLSQSREKINPKYSVSSPLLLSELDENKEKNCQYLVDDCLKFSVTCILNYVL